LVVFEMPVVILANRKEFRLILRLLGIWEGDGLGRECEVYHQYDFGRDAIEALKIGYLVDVMNVVDVELEDGQRRLRDLLVPDHNPIVFIGLY
jgi:hypothetical protein